MNGALQSTLAALMESGADDIPALNILLSDYTRYHLVLVIVGGLFLLALVLFSIFCWGRFTRSLRTDRGRRTFERKTYFWFGLLGTTVALSMAVVIAGNVSNVLDPRHGFSGSLSLLGSPRASTPPAELQEAFTTWLQSGSPEAPPGTCGTAARRCRLGPGLPAADADGHREHPGLPGAHRDVALLRLMPLNRAVLPGGSRSQPGEVGRGVPRSAGGRAMLSPWIEFEATPPVAVLHLGR